MTFRILKRPQVERDLVEHFTFIARDRLEPAERFLQSAAEAFMAWRSYRSPGANGSPPTVA